MTGLLYPNSGRAGLSLGPGGHDRSASSDPAHEASLIDGREPRIAALPCDVTARERVAGRVGHIGR